MKTNEVTAKAPEPLVEANADVDIRQLLLYRTFFTSDNPLGKSILTENDAPPQFIVLGDYDGINVTKVDFEKDKWLTEINRYYKEVLCRCDGSGSTQILTVFSNLNKTFTNLEQPRDFWEDASKYPLFCASTIHIRKGYFQSSGKQQDNLSVLAKICAKLKQKHYKPEQTAFFAYLSYDCSDAVIFWQTHVYLDVISAIDLIRNENLILGSYTICALNEGFIGEGKNVFKNTRMRAAFSLTGYGDFPELKKQFESFFGPVQIESAFGERDMFFNCKPRLTVKKLINWYKWLFSDGKGCHKYINEMSLRINRVVQKLPEKSRYTPTNHLKHVCKDIRNKLEKLPKGKPSQITQIKSLLNMLELMGTDCVRDDTFIQCLEPVNTFADLLIQNVTENSSAEHLRSMDDDIDRFISNWHALMVNTTRADGHLLDSISHIPALFDLPAKLNLLYQSFFYMIAELLKDEPNDSTLCENDRVFFVVPKQCRILQCFNLFRNPDTSYKQLLCVDIPPDKIFDATIIRTYVHESAHFCGQRHRRRYWRAKYFVSYIIHYVLFEMKVLGSHNVVTLSSPQEFVEDVFKLFIHNAGIDSSTLCKTPLEELRLLIEEYLGNSIFDMRLLREHLNSNLRKGRSSPSKYEINDYDLNRNWFFAIDRGVRCWERDSARLLNQTEILFRETYADIVMMFVLTGDWDDYIAAVLQKGEKLNELANTDLLRFFIVAKTMKWFNESDSSSNPDKLNEVFELTKEEGNVLVDPICKYLEECLEDIRKDFAGDKNVLLDKIRKRYNIINRPETPRMLYEVINDTIAEYYDHLIKKFV